MKRKIILGFALSLYCLCALAQDTADAEKDRQYVTDQLRLSIYEKPNSQSNVLKLLRSGDLVIIDEIRGPYALVTAPDGTHGWVKRGFLVTNPTARIQLLEEREKNAALFEEIEKLGDAKIIIDTYEKDMDVLVEKNQVLEAEKENAAATIAELKQEIADLQAINEPETIAIAKTEPDFKVLANTFMLYWKILVPALLLLLLLSFFISKAIVEARIRSKFHGIKIW